MRRKVSERMMEIEVQEKEKEAEKERKRMADVFVDLLEALLEEDAVLDEGGVVDGT